MPGRNNLIYALKEGKPVSIVDVESGLRCNCICPACGEQLVAKKGKKMTHHFSHYFETNCSSGYETSLHIAAKDILSKAGKMVIPAIYLEFPNSNKQNELITPAREVTIDKVELEQQYGSLIPDVVIHAGEECYFVEICIFSTSTCISLEIIFCT